MRREEFAASCREQRAGSLCFPELRLRDDFHSPA